MIDSAFRVAILDMYEGAANQGMRSIQDILRDFAKQNNLLLYFEVFNVRSKAEVPSLEFDAYISTGGPGSPLDSEGEDWETAFFGFVDKLMVFNRSKAENKKPLFLICHSYQLFCRYYGLAEVKKRKSNSFGIFPVHKTEFGFDEDFLSQLADPYWAVDSRDYQVIKVNIDKLEAFGAKVLSREKIRPHVPLERAVMAVRFSNYIFGTQFHPEADPEGMLYYFSDPEKKKQVIDKHGEEKFLDMMRHLNNYDHILLTRNTIIPNFLKSALQYKSVFA